MPELTREEDRPAESGVPPMRAQDYSELQDWPGYFRAVLGKPPRETLVAALDSFAREGSAGGLAFELAAGEGRDTLELLERGWRVVATDSHPDALSHLWPRVPEALKPRLTTVVVSFEETIIPPCDLVNASCRQPFCVRQPVGSSNAPPRLASLRPVSGLYKRRTMRHSKQYDHPM